MKLAFLIFAAASFAGAAGLLPLDQAVYRQALDEQKGKIVLVDFWATWCEPCRAELPVLVKLQQKWQPRGLVLITVSADEPSSEASAREFLAKSDVPAPAYIKHVENDEEFIDSVDKNWSGALPALFLYDRDGRRVRSFIGETETAAIERALHELTEPATTK